MGWSRAEIDGWQGHYRRTRRWFERLLAVANNSQHSMDEQIDFALVFFQSAYHLRDYLAREDAASRDDLDALFSGSAPLRVCRDLCNSSKHRVITKPSIDAEPWILREDVGPSDYRLRVKAGDMHDLVSLAYDCMLAWNAFLLAHGLDPRGLSPLATTLAEAMTDSVPPPRGT